MSTPDGWIKTSERKPTEKDVPVAYLNNNRSEHGHGIINGIVWRDEGLPLPDAATHWIPLTAAKLGQLFNVLPAPPAKELTQREKDEEALKEWHLSHYTNIAVHSADRIAWHAALSYRDGQNRQSLCALQGAPSFSREREILSELRRRSGLDT